MSNKKDNEFANEHLTPEIARKQIIEIGKVARIPPDVGIFDSPTRCFIVNTEWWAHIAGMVHWLADVTAWQDAENEEYFAIREILKFMQGMECMDFALRQSPDDSCIMQQTLDGGETWTDVFDFSECTTIQDKSETVNIQNATTYAQPNVQDIYNNYVSNYAGTPSSVYPDLAQPSGDKSALNAAYCNAIWTLVNVSSDAAIAYYREFADGLQSEFNVGLGITAAVITVIGLAAAIPTAGASLTALAPAAALWGASIGVSAVIGNRLVDYWQSHTIDQFQDTDAREAVACYLYGAVSSSANTWAAMKTALAANTLSGNARAIKDFMSILMEKDATYAAFLEKWNNNKQYADVGIDLECPCTTLYKVWVWDFSEGLGPFTIVQGTYSGGRVQGVDGGDAKGIQLTMPFTPTWRVRAGKIFTERILGIANGSDDTVSVWLRPTPGTNSGGTIVVSGGFRPNGIDIRCVNYPIAPLYSTGGNQLWMAATVTDQPGSAIYIDRIELQFLADYAKGGYITDDGDICT